MTSMSAVECICLVAFLVVVPPPCEGHGRLLLPASRSSMWRMGFNNPPNYQDNELWCGGYAHQWQTNGGKCGVCGDPWDKEKEHEAGGKYAQGIIAQRYKQGQVIEVTIQITAHHQGWFEFRICDHDDVTSLVQQSCLDEHILPLATSGETRHSITGIYQEYYSYNLQLPLGMTCRQCLLQWRYNAGNNWGCDADGTCGIGSGPQEQFYGCADVEIVKDLSIVVPDTTTRRIQVTRTTISATTTTSSPLTSGDCVPSEIYKEVIGIADWCKVNCGATADAHNADCKTVCACT